MLTDRAALVATEKGTKHTHVQTQQFKVTNYMYDYIIQYIHKQLSLRH